VALYSKVLAGLAKIGKKTTSITKKTNVTKSIDGVEDVASAGTKVRKIPRGNPSVGEWTDVQDIMFDIVQEAINSIPGLIEGGLIGIALDTIIDYVLDHPMFQQAVADMAESYRNSADPDTGGLDSIIIAILDEFGMVQEEQKDSSKGTKRIIETAYTAVDGVLTNMQPEDEVNTESAKRTLSEHVGNIYASGKSTYIDITDLADGTTTTAEQLWEDTKDTIAKAKKTVENIGKKLDEAYDDASELLEDAGEFISDTYNDIVNPEDIDDPDYAKKKRKKK